MINYISMIDNIEMMNEMNYIIYESQIPLNESFTDSVKKFFERIIEFIKKIWNKLVSFFTGVKDGYNGKKEEAALEKSKEIKKDIPNFYLKLDSPIEYKDINRDQYKKLDSVLKDLKYHTENFDYNINAQNIDTKYNEIKDRFNQSVFDFYKTSKEELQNIDKFFEDKKLYEINNKAIDFVEHDMLYYKRTSGEQNERLKFISKKVNELTEKINKIKSNINNNENPEYYKKLEKIYVIYAGELADYIFATEMDIRVRDQGIENKTSQLVRMVSAVGRNKDKMIV